MEREFLQIIMRDYPAGLAQVQTCLVSDWDGGFLELQVNGGVPFERMPQPLPGPALTVDETSATFIGFESLVWIDERGLICTIEVVAIVDEGRVPDRISMYVGAARGTYGARLHYPASTSPRT
jgi:hypothetical protein